MKYIYSFKEGNKDMRDLLGGKGANLAEMINLGLPIPNGFTITTDACLKYYKDNQTLNNELISQIEEQIEKLEKSSGKKIGDNKNPLLLSVRSGARISMPGMLDTILNLGMNDEIAVSFAEITENPTFVYDSYRRFIQMYADVVMGFKKSSFDNIFNEVKKDKGIKKDTDLIEKDLKEIIKKYKEEYKKQAGVEFPSNPKKQLIEAIKAVFRSWNNERAVIYRRLNNIDSSWGTAVNIQEMVYGNLSDQSGTGVVFTRNPSTGENELYGEYLMNAQGEDIVAGIRTPEFITTLKDKLPECYQELENICKTLEDHYQDMQDMEFTIENNKLYILQTRNGKRTVSAALKIAIDLQKKGVITKEEALLRIDANQLDQLLHPSFNKAKLSALTPITKGLPASPGAATGKIYFKAEDIMKAYKNNEKDLILVRIETSPEDIEGMNVAKGILTIYGGMTSHAAVVARGMGKCCVCGCSELKINEKNKTLTTKNNQVLKEEDYISLDGTTGYVYSEKIETEAPIENEDFKTLMNWADKIRTLKIRANADTKKDALQAKSNGAEGIGLCRTEHMFFEEERILNFRKMILSNTPEEKETSLNKILPYQKKDFEELFKIMEGLPVTIRLLDPPLHEFLPKEKEEIHELAELLKITEDEIKQRITSLKEFNPMMGHRGCRLLITYPEIAKMQTKAIIETAIKLNKQGYDIKPEIMIPLVGDINELKYLKELINKEIETIIAKENIKIKYQIGTMIETPRAALVANKLAEEAEFFSFGTNDLTQMTFGFSRDDSTIFLNEYLKKNIFASDPFISIDEDGVGELVKIAIAKGKKTNSNLKLGICGEQGGDTKTINFCHTAGLNYISCSPYRIPNARLAAAQAKIKEEIL